MDILKRGGKIRYIIEITPYKIKYCNKLYKLVDELRHLDGFKEGLAVYETQYMTSTNLIEANSYRSDIYQLSQDVLNIY